MRRYHAGLSSLAASKANIPVGRPFSFFFFFRLFIPFVFFLFFSFSIRCNRDMILDETIVECFTLLRYLCPFKVHGSFPIFQMNQQKVTKSCRIFPELIFRFFLSSPKSFIKLISDILQSANCLKIYLDKNHSYRSNNFCSCIRVVLAILLRLTYFECNKISSANVKQK